MKKAIIGFTAVGALIALRPVLKRRIVQKMQEHCQQMAAKCKQMMAGPPTERGEAAGMPHCKQMREHPEQESPQFVGSGEVVTA
jgi:hypothetical protein